MSQFFFEVLQNYKVQKDVRSSSPIRKKEDGFDSDNFTNNNAKPLHPRKRHSSEIPPLQNKDSWGVTSVAWHLLLTFLRCISMLKCKELTRLHFFYFCRKSKNKKKKNSCAWDPRGYLCQWLFLNLRKFSCYRNNQILHIIIFLLVSSSVQLRDWCTGIKLPELCISIAHCAEFAK